MGRMSYSDACDAGYDGPPPGGSRGSKNACRGWASWRGPCGATDCSDCYPHTWDEEACEECDILLDREGNCEQCANLNDEED